MPRYLVLLLAALTLPLSIPQRATACLMVPLTYAGDVDQSAQHAVVLFHEGREELILQVEPTFPDEDQGPDRLTWIITVPNDPDQYGVVDDAIFKEAQNLYTRLAQLAEKQRPRTNKLGTLSNPRYGTGSLVVSPTVQVGPYDITPVRGVGADGATALNSYLSEHGFPAESADFLNIFFLCSGSMILNWF